MTTVAGIADLLLSLQPKSVRLALLLLEQQPVHDAVITELLLVYLLEEEDTLKQAVYQCLQAHAPRPLIDTLRQYNILACRLHSINSNFQNHLYRHLRDEGEFEQTAQLVILIYQRTGKGLSYLLEVSDQTTLIQLLEPSWDQAQRHLDLSNRDLRQFPKEALRAFDPVYSLDLRHNAWLAPVSAQSLAEFPALTQFYLEGSVWTDDQIEGWETVEKVLPQVTIIT